MTTTSNPSCCRGPVERDPVSTEPDERVPEFMTEAMREKISETCMREKHVLRIRKCGAKITELG